MIVLGLVAMTTLFVVAGERPGATGNGRSPLETDPLSSRTVDTTPLALQEVFPDSSAVRPSQARPYRITMTHTDTDCRTAATGDMGSLLAGRGCSQVVRAGMVAPYGGYEVTAGLFNLVDATGAADVDGQLRHLIETGDGSFAALPAGRIDPDAPPTSQVGWRARGHYLLYCVITRPGGALVTSDDPYAERITADLVDSYLGTTVLGRRASA
jgi:hypothetical protein